MNSHLPVLNAFIEDTCVIAVIAYLLARGSVLELLSSPHKKRTSNQNLLLGLLFGVIGVSEIVFPGARSPYVVHTLLVTFATLCGGLPVGATAALTIACGALVLRSPVSPVAMGATLGGAAVLAEILRLMFRGRSTLLRGCISGALVQASVIAANNRIHLISRDHVPPAVALMSVPANAFGVLVLQLIVNEAHMRVEGEKHRLDAERAQAMVSEARLVSLRARVHPHFLFNTLTSIAALCRIAPDKAEDAIVRLSQLMRRVLESAPSTLQCLGDELEYVRGYLQIEQLRIGDRLQVCWEIQAGTENVKTPPFSVQTLVENAINHGICPQIQPGKIKIAVRASKAHVLVAVVDDGAGMDGSGRTQRHSERNGDGREHGLEILTRQLVFLYGKSARIRIFSRLGSGTIACFALPSQSENTNLSLARSFEGVLTGRTISNTRA